MDLATLARTTVELLAAGLVAGIALACLAWGLLAILRPLAASTRYLLLLAALVCVALVPIATVIEPAWPERPASGSVSPDPQDEATGVAVGLAERPMSGDEMAPLTDDRPAVAGEPEATGALATAEAARTSFGPRNATRSGGFAVPGGWLYSVAGLWLLGLVVVAFRLLHGYALLRRCRRKSSPASEPEQRLLVTLLREVGMTRPVELRVSGELGVPMAAGLLRPVIFVPAELPARIGRADLRHILLHELAHLARRDDWTLLIQRLVQAALFFHPAVHAIARRADLERELACDAWVVERSGGVRKPYARSLLRVAALRLEPALPLVEGSAMMFRSRIETRIRLLAQAGRSVSARVARRWLTGSVALLVLVGVAAAQLVPALSFALGAGTSRTITPENAGEIVLLDVLETPVGVNEVAFHPDGDRLVAVAAAGRAYVWDVADRTLIETLQVADYGDVTGLAFSSDGALMATGDALGQLRLWDAGTFEPLGESLTLTDQDTGARRDAGILSLAFSPDGRTIATGNALGEIALWDVATRTLLGTPVQDSFRGICELVFGPDGSTLVTGSLVSGPFDGRLVLWDAATLEPRVQPLLEIDANACGFGFSPDGALMAGGHDDGITIWDGATNEIIGQPLRGHMEGGATLWELVFSPDGALIASASGDDTVILWDVEEGRAVGRLAADGDGEARNGVSDVAVSPAGDLVAFGNWSGDVLIWGLIDSAAIGAGNAAQLAPEIVLDTASHEINQVSFSPDGGRVAAAGAGPVPFVWDVATASPLLRPDGPVGGETFGVAFSPDGTLLASAVDRGYAQLWDAATFEKVGPRMELPATDRKPLIRVAFSSDGALLAAGDLGGTVAIWDVASRALVGEPIDAGSYAVCALAFSPDGALLATGTMTIGAVPGRIQLWDLATRRPLGPPLVELEGGNACGLAFSPDGALLVGSEEAGLGVWDARSLEPVGAAMAGEGSPTYLAFQRDGELVASLGADGTATLWDLATRSVVGEPLTDARAGGTVSGLKTLAFSPDGRTLATGYQSGAVVLWGVAPGSP